MLQHDHGVVAAGESPLNANFWARLPETTSAVYRLPFGFRCDVVHALKIPGLIAPVSELPNDVERLTVDRYKMRVAVIRQVHELLLLVS